MIIDLVFPVIHRCSFLCLDLNIATLNRLLTLPPNSLHMLQSMIIDVEDNTRVANPIPFATTFESCPQLHTFKLVTGHLCLENLRITNFNVPWHQLTTLCLSSPSIFAHEYLNVLHKCISLQECNISISSIDNLVLQRMVQRSHCPTVLSFLHTLYIKFFDSDLEDDSCCFLRVFCLPRLRNFRPKKYEYPAHWSLPMFQPVLSDTIQELDLSGFKFPENLPKTLALVPNLKILWLRDSGFHKNPEIMRALGEGTLSPCLTTLYFAFVENFDFLFNILVARIAAARANHGIVAFSIKVAVLDWRHDDLPDEARLMALTESGVQIQLGHPGW